MKQTEAAVIASDEIMPGVYLIRLDCPLITSRARPGQFVIAMCDERAERIPLTIADFDASAGTITMVIMVVGTSSAKLCRLEVGDEMLALMGPLGQPSEIEDSGTVVMVAGGVGTAPIYPIAKAMRERGNRVLSIQGASLETRTSGF